MEKRSYPVKNFPVRQLAESLEEWYQSRGFETQVLSTQFRGLIIQARKEGFLRTVVGMSSAITVTLDQKETYLLVEVGGANWADKAGAAAIGLVVFWPTLVSAGFGAFEQSRILKETWDVVHRYIMSYNASTGAGSMYSTPSQPQWGQPPSQPQWTPPPPHQQSPPSQHTPYVPPPTAMIEEPKEVPKTCLLNEGESWGTIIIDSGPHTGEVFDLNLPFITIGRNPECNIILTKDESISRNHACIYLKEGEIYLSDQGSTHGTFLNEKPVSAAPIKDNSIIQCGKTVMRFCLQHDRLDNLNML